jgi:Uma2 family endonuclease
MANAVGLAVKESEGYTYRDYLRWGSEERYELIDGVAYNMTPVPSRKHQGILLELARQLANFLTDKECDVYVAPFDVRLPERDEADEDITTVVQPDISVICDAQKLDDQGCRGAPDLIIEIISPFTARKDMKDKLLLYERHRVKEYWIVHPEEKVVMRYRLEKDNRYGRASIYTDEDTVTIDLLNNLKLDLTSVFD